MALKTEFKLIASPKRIAFSERPQIARKKDEARGIAKLCARIADDRKGEHVVILRMTELMALTDYFVIVSSRNVRQVQAIADEIDRSLRKPVRGR